MHCSSSVLQDVTVLARTLQSMAKRSHHTQQQQQFQAAPITLRHMEMAMISPLAPADIPLDLPCLPLNTMEHLDEFESLMFNDVHFKQVSQYLGALGGLDLADTMRRILSKLMTNRLAESFNWAGRPPKRAFRGLRCRELVLSAVRRNPMLIQPVLESDVEEFVKKWLRYAAGRR